MVRRTRARGGNGVFDRMLTKRGGEVDTSPIHGGAGGEGEDSNVDHPPRTIRRPPVRSRGNSVGKTFR